MQSWDRKAFDEYMKSQRTKRKQIMRARNRALNDEIREASRKMFVEDEVDDSEYDAFVRHAFPDVDNIDDKCELEQ